MRVRIQRKDAKTQRRKGKRRGFVFLFVVFCFASSRLCAFALPSFDEQIGKETYSIQTPEDKSLLSFYRMLYEKHRQSPASNTIPKIAHFVWLGPRDFPQESLKNIKAWTALHPDWQVKFWTDIDRDIFLPNIQKQRVSDLTFFRLGPLYYNAENFGEKATLLAYEILWQEGGLYLDHDVKPLHAFDSFHDHFDFYCGLEPLAPSILSTAVFPGSHLIAARPEHPILDHTMEWLLAHWDRLERIYPGNYVDALKNRVFHRTLFALSAGIQEKAGKTTKDIVFPSEVFNGAVATPASFATHAHANTWLDKSNDEQKKVLYRLRELEQTSKTMLLSLIGLGGLNIGVALLLFSKLKRPKK